MWSIWGARRTVACIAIALAMAGGCGSDNKKSKPSNTTQDTDIIPCDAAAPCPDGLSCCSGICTSSTCCTADRDCSGGYCDGGTCTQGTRPSCSADAPCPSGVCWLQGGQCVECITNDNCADPTLVCTAERTCQSATQCTPSLCAQTGQVCDGGRCRNCISASDCGDLICGSDGKCKACTQSPQCGVGRVCSNNVCVNSGTCSTNADCGNRVCKTNLDGSRSCADCSAGECDATHTCESGVCVAINPECASDTDCDPPRKVCAGQLCVDGCAPGTCPEGQSCNTANGHCVVNGGTGTKTLGEECGAHAECASGACWAPRSSLNSVAICSKACERGLDCPDAFVCVEPGDGAYCVPNAALNPPPTANVEVWGSCTAARQGPVPSTECKSGICNGLPTGGGECLETCSSNYDCEAAPVGGLFGGPPCTQRWAIGVDSNGDNQLDPDLGELYGFAGLCTENIGADLEVDELCGSGGQGNPTQADHDRCATGFCLQTPDLSQPARCGTPCCTPSDCNNPYTVCKPIDMWDGDRSTDLANPGSDPYNDPYGFAKMCVWREYAGTKLTGEECASDAECRSEICIAGASGVKRCTHTCCQPEDCVGYEWASSCRAPFPSSAAMGDANHGDMVKSLGRWRIAEDGTPLSLTAHGVAKVCMPQ